MSITETLLKLPRRKQSNQENLKKVRYQKHCRNQRHQKYCQNPSLKKCQLKPASGCRGMKLWLEQQKGFDGNFLVVAPDVAFQSGDCVRVGFRLNFQDFLTIINWGTSGHREVIFPLNRQSNKIFPKTDNYLPDNQGWEFDEQAGKEQLIFIISRSDVSENFIDDFLAKRDLVTEDSADLEIYDRDLKPRTGENKSVYVLASNERLEKPLVFRLTLKHR